MYKVVIELIQSKNQRPYNDPKDLYDLSPTLLLLWPHSLILSPSSLLRPLLHVSVQRLYLNEDNSSSTPGISIASQSVLTF